MKRKRTLRIAGLYLWAVRAKGLDVQLWITTPTPSIFRAIEKAEKYIAKTFEGDFKGIVEAKSHGTIDA